jgi:zinc transporter
MDPVTAFSSDDTGKSRRVEPGKTPAKSPSSGFLWVHLQYGASEAGEWLLSSGLDQHVIEALTAEETRPRCTVHGDGALLNLRGVNLNPGSEPEDMVSIRLWIERHRVISVCMRPLWAVEDLAGAIANGTTPKTPGEFLSRLALRLSDRAEPVVAELNEKIDDLEEQMLEDPRGIQRKILADARREAIMLRRFMFPQRDALTTLEIEDFDWMDNRERSRIREAAERVMRLGEELDGIRDRAQVVHDEIIDARAELMNRQMLLLTVVAAVFLPLGLLTGLLGINVGGIPGAQSSYAFWVVCGLLLVFGAGLAVWFRRAMLK